MYIYFYIVICGVVRRYEGLVNISKEHARYKIGVSQRMLR